VDANIIKLKSGAPALETKLDGTVYELPSGAVRSWCPKNTAVRRVLGALKDKSEPVDLKTYPVRVEGSAVFVKLA
jgi:nitrite reductase/ring-hydroxylating ferredoxin subunit